MATAAGASLLLLLCSSASASAADDSSVPKAARLGPRSSGSGSAQGSKLTTMMVPMAEGHGGSENFLYMGGDLFGQARGKCTLMPGMGFFGEVEQLSDGGAIS